MKAAKGDVVKVKLADDCGNHPEATVLGRDGTHLIIKVRRWVLSVPESDVVSLVRRAPLDAV